MIKLPATLPHHLMSLKIKITYPLEVIAQRTMLAASLRLMRKRKMNTNRSSHRSSNLESKVTKADLWITLAIEVRRSLRLILRTSLIWTYSKKIWKKLTMIENDQSWSGKTQMSTLSSTKEDHRAQEASWVTWTKCRPSKKTLKAISWNKVTSFSPMTSPSRMVTKIRNFSLNALSA